jgi:hypothetical protein
MSTARWDGSASKEGVVVGVTYSGAIGVRPGGSTTTVWAGPVVEIKTDLGNFVTGIALDTAGRTGATVTTATVFKKFSDGTTMTATTWAGTASAGDIGQVNVGDIVQATSTTLTVLKRQL